MEITISKRGLKKILAVLMAMIIALSSMWTGLGVVSYATGEDENSELQIMEGEVLALTLYTDKEEYIKFIPSKSGKHTITFSGENRSNLVTLCDESKVELESSYVEDTMDAWYVSYELEENKIYYLCFASDYNRNINICISGPDSTQYELDVNGSVEVTATDERIYIELCPEKTGTYILSYWLYSFNYDLYLLDENKEIIDSLYNFNDYSPLELSGDKVYYLGVDVAEGFEYGDTMTFQLYYPHGEIFENEGAINVYVVGDYTSYVKFVPEKSGIYDFYCENDFIDKSLCNETEDTTYFPELKTFYELEAGKTYYLKLSSNDLGVEAVAASVSFVGTDIGFCGDNVYWSFDENTGELVISGEGTMDYSTFDEYKESIKSIIVDEGVTSICYSAFSDCVNLTQVSMPDSVSNIESSAFADCTSLKNIVIPEGVTSISDSTFNGCSSLENVIIPVGVTSIGDNAFWLCESLGSIKLPDSVESIGCYCFYGCVELACIELPKNLKELSTIAFEGCENITEYIIDESNESFSVDENGVLFNKDKTTLITYPEGNASTSYEIPESVVKIDECAFSGCSNLVAIEIPDNVVEVGERAFANCTALISVQIPGSVESIGNYTFQFCTGLENIIISEGVTGIGMYAFAGCSNLTQVTIPGSVSEVESYAFGSCKSLKNVIITEGVTSIGSSAFKGCTSLESIIIPEGVVKIGSRAFSGCSALNNIIIPGSVTTIDFEAFTECESLTDVYYMGTEAEWNQISMVKYSDLSNATIHFLDSDCTHENKTSHSQQDATCTVNGYTAGVYCTDCEEWLSGHEVIEAKHTPSTYTQNATCGVNGYKLTSCSVCGETLDYEIISAEEHKFSSWAETKKATCTVDGEESRSCSLCGETETRVVTAPGHSWSVWKVTEATLLNAGEKTRSCSRCTATEKEIIPKLEGEVSEDAYSGVKVEYTDSSYDGERMQVVVEEDYTGSQYLGQSYGNFVSWNIKTYVNGLEVQPDAPVLVTIPIPSAFNKNMIVVYHVDSVSGKLEKISPVVIEGNNITFLAESFSVYMVIDESTAQEKDPSENCSCNCHKTGFMGIIWKIIRIFLKFFKANPVCECGAAHY